MPKFNQTSCSECGRNFGPGDAGFSFCEDHADLRPTDVDTSIREMPSEDVDVIVLVKGEERYVIAYTASTRVQALRTLARWTCDRDLSFSPFDWIELSKQIRERSGVPDGPF